MTARPLLVVLDADSTLIEDEVIELLAEEAGSHSEVARITEEAMRGDIDFAESLHQRVETLAGLPVTAFDVVSRRVRETPGIRELVDGVHAVGGSIGVVSGGFHEILDPLHAALGLNHLRANRLEVRDDRLTGRVCGEIVDAEAKAMTLREWADKEGVPRSCTVAVGDGANDLLMLAEAGLGIAFCAKPRLRDAADVIIDTRDLSQLLPLLGLRG